MMYALEDLLKKMGTPEVAERGHVGWHYFDAARQGLAGHAQVRLEGRGAYMTAELKHVRADYEDDEGNVHERFTESFHMLAVRAGCGRYRVMRMGFDGADYDVPQKAVVELGLGVFHARALDISIRMVEQMFNKQDILDPLDPAMLPEATARRAIFARREGDMRARKESFGVILPFRPRMAAGA